MIDVLLTETIVLTRPAVGGAYTLGRWVPAGGDVTLTLKASVQPVPGEVMENNPELERSRETVAIWTKEALFTSVTSPLLKADRILYNGKTYEVITVEQWAGMMPHFKATAERLPMETP